MEASISSNDEDDQFYDTFDDFPFYDFTNTDQFLVSTPDSTLSTLDPSKNEPHDSLKSQQSLESSSLSTIRRRRSLYKNNQHRTLEDGPRDPEDSSVSSATSRIHGVTKSRERKERFRNILKESQSEIDKAEPNQEQVNCPNNDPVDISVPELDESLSSHFLVYLAGLMIKAIGFQINLIISLITLPTRSLYNCYMFFINPYGTVRHGREFLIVNLLRIWGIICKNVSPSVHEWLKEQQFIWKLVLQYGWAFLWAAYVCFTLCGLLLSSFVISGFVIRHIVKEPIQMKEILNFDYTKNNPVAFVPIIYCPDLICGLDCIEKIEVGKIKGLHQIPTNHKLQVSLSLTLPESDYNQKLGMFQVRVDFLSANGKTLASIRRPCMLQYKSLPIRLLLTFLNTVPLITGYSSESQILNINMKGFTEGHVPTSCLKVMIEQRAEFRPGAGIPEIYAASLKLESELPFLKRLMWYWKKTLFVWIAYMLFFMELLCALVCCRGFIMPRARIQDGFAEINLPQNRQPIESTDSNPM